MTDIKLLEKALQTGNVQVKFTKTDGTERTMVCTKDPKIISKFVPEREGEPKRTINENVISVFDLDKKQFRSFRKDSVIVFAFPAIHMDTLDILTIDDVR